MNKELIARLRSMLKDTTDDAADAIESLQAEVARLEPVSVWVAMNKVNFMLFANESDARKMQPTPTSDFEVFKSPILGVAKPEPLITVESSLRYRLESEQQKSADLLDDVRELKSRLEKQAQQAPKKTLEVMAQEAALEQAQLEQCILEHNFASLDTAGNRHPEFRYAGYKGQPIKAGASQDQADAYAEGVRATKQAQPERAPDCRIELVNAIHTLASHYENKCYKFQDDEEVLKAAQGDIAHAMQIAAKWNWNGNSAQQSQSVEAAQPEPSKDFQELAKVYASMYASPHHIVFSTEGLKRFVAAAAQQAQPERAPLTQTQVVDAFCELKHNTQYVSVFDAGVRFAEKHHGIKGGAA